MKTLCFCFKRLLQINSGEVLRKGVPKSLKYHYENKHFAIVRFHDFLSRTCIGVWSLIGHLGVFCEPLRSGLNPAYISKQKR